MGKSSLTHGKSALLWLLCSLALSCGGGKALPPSRETKSDASRQDIPGADRHSRGKDVVSLVELMANPDRFDGKNVFVEGFLISDFEGSYLFLSRESGETPMLSNSIRIRGRNGRNFEKFDRQYVAFCGRFRSNVRGDLNMFSPGEIVDATFYDVVPKLHRPVPTQSSGK